MVKSRLFAVVGLMVLIVPAARAGNEIPQKILNRADAFLKTETRGKDILGYLHFGAKYGGHTYKETKFVTDGDGKRIPGYFALVYDFKWDKDGKTQVAFLCDDDGDVYQIQILKTNAVLSQPFAVANLSIKVLGAVILEAFKDNMTEEQKKDVQKAVDDADSKALLTDMLKLQQSYGK